MERIPRHIDDLRAELTDQIRLLQLACDNFDSGHHVAGRSLAATLRTLLHSQPWSKRRRGLLDQLQLCDLQFIDTAGPELQRHNRLAEPIVSAGLVKIQIATVAATVTATHVAPCRIVGAPIDVKWLSFEEWWESPALQHSSGRTFSRKQIVLNVAETDGGSHVDPDLDEGYAHLSHRRGPRLHVFLKTSDGAVPGGPISGRIEFICLRQIAWEVLETLRLKAPEYFPS